MTLRFISFWGLKMKLNLCSTLKMLNLSPQGDLVTDVEVDSLTSDAFILRSRNTSDRVLIVCAGRTAISWLTFDDEHCIFEACYDRQMTRSSLFWWHFWFATQEDNPSGWLCLLRTSTTPGICISSPFEASNMAQHLIFLLMICWWYVEFAKKSSFLTSLRARFITYCFLSNPLTWIIQRWQEKSLRFILMFFDYNTHWMCMSHLVGSFEVSWFSSMLGYFGHIFPCLNW